MRKRKAFSEDDIREKMKGYCVRITSRVKGKDKNYLMLDAIKRANFEAQIIREIIHIHYSIVELKPELKGKEFTEIKKYILDKIKL